MRSSRGLRRWRRPCPQPARRGPVSVGTAERVPGSGRDRRPRPLVRARRRPPGRRLPALLVHQGDRAGGRIPGRRAGAGAGDAGARRGVRTRPARPCAGCPGDRGRRRRHQPAVRRPGGPGRAAGRQLRPRRRPGARLRRASSTPPSRSARARSAWPAARAPRSTATARSSTASPGRCGRAGWPRCRRSRRTSRCAGSRAPTRFDAAAGVNHERTEVRDEAGRVHRGRPVDHVLHAARAPPARGRAGLRVRGLWSVTPGAYAAAPPSIDCPNSCWWPNERRRKSATGRSGRWESPASLAVRARRARPCASAASCVAMDDVSPVPNESLSVRVRRPAHRPHRSRARRYAGRARRRGAGARERLHPPPDRRRRSGRQLRRRHRRHPRLRRGRRDRRPARWCGSTETRSSSTSATSPRA